ncbi:MAG TPA: folylpolyglutamate synthase/dihydrofolate synthase family protein [Anaerolineales bacterium]|nr:folylpolyglutamate synthase/dihydrofolate synthase family protein [Anaerolineales bacterium]
MVDESFQESLDYLYSFIDYSVERSYRYSPDVFDLARVRELLRSVGDPQHAFHTFHVAGTKGKGSVSALLASSLRAAGYRTGLYTSPHLLRFAERIQVDGQEIPEGSIVELVGNLRPKVAAVPGLTTYEIVTALGFMHFHREQVDCAVVEVGLGGRLDATNVLQPNVSVITSLSYDHMHLLGDTLSEIAREKAGIIKPDVPVVLAPQQREAELVVESVAREMGSPLVRVGRDWLFAPGSRGLSGQSLSVWSAAEQPLMDAYVQSAGDEEWAPPRFEIPLLGYHQVVNAATAYAALQVGNDHGLRVSANSIRQGFRSVTWPGRFQILSRSPTVVVDSAHNRDSALKLRIALDDYFPGRPVTLVFGASGDKDIPGMLDELAPRISRLIVTQAVHPRAADPDETAELGRGHGLRVEVAVPVAEALERALARPRPDEVILAAGSLFVAGEVLAAWNKRDTPEVVEGEGSR